MKCMKRWLGIMMSVMLAAGSLQAPVYAAETGETAVEAAVEEESIEIAEPIDAEELEVDFADEEPEEEEDFMDDAPLIEESDTITDDSQDHTEDDSHESENIKDTYKEAIDVEEEELEDSTETIEEALYMENVNNASQDTVSEKQMRFNGHTYKRFDVAKSWTEAKEYCESIGGHLVTITSAEEQNAVTDLISDGSKYQYWLGANDLSGSYKWVTGEEFVYSNWAEDQPDHNSGEHYLQIYLRPNPVGSNAYEWNDIREDNTFYRGEEDFFQLDYIGFICEWDDDISAPLFDYLEVDIDGNVAVHWKPENTEKGISGYRIRHKIKGTSEWRTTTVSDGDSSSVILRNLSTNDYEIEICSYMIVNGKEIESPYSEPAKCPVPVIEIISPVNGSLFGDSYALNPIVDFHHRAENTNEGSLRVYDNSHRIVFSQQLKKTNEDDTYTCLSAICIEGYTWDESKVSDPRGVLKPDEFYSITIDEKAIQFLDEVTIEPYQVPVYFSGINETDESWRFKTVDLSYPGLINPGGLKIDEQYYHILFDKEWKKIIEKDDGTNGLCFGLAYTVGAYEYGFPCLRDLTSGYSKLSDVPIGENSELLKYVQIAHLLQAYKEYKRYDNSDRVYKLYNSVKSGKNVIIDLECSVGRHSVYSVGLVDDSDISNIKIAVYDPAYPNISFSNGILGRSFVTIATVSKGSKNTEWGFEYKTNLYDYDLLGYHEVDRSYDSLIIDTANDEKDINEASVTGISDKIYTGKVITQRPTVKLDSTQLKLNTDYTISYENNIGVGKASITITGKGRYVGTKTIEFKILPAATTKVTCTNVASGIKVSWESVTGATRYRVYRDNKPLFETSALNVTDKSVKYNSGTKYVYKVVATAKDVGDSPKSRTATMYRLMPVGIKSLTNPSAGKMTVTYDKANGSSGYVVRYGLKSDMSDAKVITVSGANTTSRTFSGMKKGKTYYVQVRTYKIENLVRYYSGYCTTKKITITK